MTDKKKNKYNIIVQMEKYNSVVLRLPVVNYMEEKKESGQKHLFLESITVSRVPKPPTLSTYTRYINSNVN